MGGISPQKETQVPFPEVGGRDGGQADTVALSQSYFSWACHRPIKNPNLAGDRWEVEIKPNILEPHGKQRDILTLGVPRGRVERFPGAQASDSCSSHRLEDAAQTLSAPGTESSGRLLLLPLGFH